METDMNDPTNHCPLSTGKMPQGDLNAPWSLRFERDGTEDVAVISDADGDVLGAVPLEAEAPGGVEVALRHLAGAERAVVGRIVHVGLHFSGSGPGGALRHAL